MSCPLAKVALSTLTEAFGGPCVPLTHAPSAHCEWDAAGFAHCAACRNATKHCHPVCSRNRCISFPRSAEANDVSGAPRRNCTLASCFEVRPACHRRPLPIFVYSAESFRLDQMTRVGAFVPWARERGRKFALVDDPAEACLLVVHADSALRDAIHPHSHPNPRSPPSADRAAAEERARVGLRWWRGGLNHVLWDPNHWVRAAGTAAARTLPPPHPHPRPRPLHTIHLSDLHDQHDGTSARRPA